MRGSFIVPRFVPLNPKLHFCTPTSASTSAVILEIPRYDVLCFSITHLNFERFSQSPICYLTIILKIGCILSLWNMLYHHSFSVPQNIQFCFQKTQIKTHLVPSKIPNYFLLLYSLFFHCTYRKLPVENSIRDVGKLRRAPVNAISTSAC